VPAAVPGIVKYAISCRSAEGAVEVTLKAGVNMVGDAHGPPATAPYANWNVVEADWFEVTCHPQMLMDWLAAAWNRAVVVAVAGDAVAVRLQVIRLVGPTAVWVWAEGPKRRATPITKPGRNNFFMMWPSRFQRS
jgi:hypothetical protein